jgi:hypothetical protein
VDRVWVLLDDLPRLGVDQPAVAVEDWIVIVLPHVGHCPSCAAIDSVASRRDEQ